MSAPADLLTPAQAAERLQVPESWVRDKARAGTIPHRRIGKHLRFSLADVEAIVRDGERQPTARVVRPARRSA